MIKNILDLLMFTNHYGKHESIEIAKGKNEIQTTIKGGITQIKRIWKTK